MDVNQNDFFREGGYGIILLLAGGQLEVKSSDKVVANEFAIYIQHGGGGTQTMVPWNAVAWVRMEPPKGRARPAFQNDVARQLQANAELGSRLHELKEGGDDGTGPETPW